MVRGCDMIASLQNLPQFTLEDGIKLKRAFVGDKEEILAFVSEHFQKSWVYETEAALFAHTCLIAAEHGKICGFACYDVSAKGFFGPIGVLPSMRGRGIGAALLLRALEAMKADGYGYAIIGWVADAEPFYRKTVAAEFIKNGTPENSVYADMVKM